MKLSGAEKKYKRKYEQMSKTSLDFLKSNKKKHKAEYKPRNNENKSLCISETFNTHLAFMLIQVVSHGTAKCAFECVLAMKLSNLLIDIMLNVFLSRWLQRLPFSAAHLLQFVYNYKLLSAFRPIFQNFPRSGKFIFIFQN